MTATKTNNPMNQLWQTLSAADVKEVASRSGAVCEGTRLRLSVMGQGVIIDPGQMMITRSATQEPVSFLLQLVVLQYLLKAQELPLADRLVSPQEFVGGEFFFRGPHAFKLKPLEEKFGEDKKAFLQAGIQLGGHPVSLADAGFRLPALPRIPLTYVLWCADEEFPAKIGVLFDATAERHLPLDMLWTLVNLTSKQLLNPNNSGVD
jgi:hypothetical protein